MQDIGLIGLAVMGQNLALNMAEKGWKVSVYNRTVQKVSAFIDGSARGSGIKGFSDLLEFVRSLARPRKIILMIKAGSPVDDIIDKMVPHLEKGDIIIDGGNSFFEDTVRREKDLRSRNLLYLGVGISGGEEGARHGPSIMPGGANEAWVHVKDIFQSIAAHVDNKPCCEWVGQGGAGHYVKMVHNGIEYGDMQLIAESYDLLKRGLGCTADELAALFSEWNTSYLESYLIEITASIFRKKDIDGTPLIDKIRDVAGQKGTGKWTVMNALDLGEPLSLIGEAVFARFLTGCIHERSAMSERFGSDVRGIRTNKKTFFKRLEKALYAAKIIAYTQGFALIKRASDEYGWDIDRGSCALMWRGGCIIRSAFLNRIDRAYAKNKNLPLLILDPFFARALQRSITSLRRIVTAGTASGIPLPCLSAALFWYDSICSSQLPSNLIQAQRDFFGAHTFERVDAERGQYFHEEWS